MKKKKKICVLQILREKMQYSCEEDDCLPWSSRLFRYPYKDRMVNVLAVHSFGLLEEKGSE